MKNRSPLLKACDSLTDMMQRRSNGLAFAGLLIVASLVGCSGINEESLDSAAQVGEAPAGFTARTGPSSGFADSFSVELSWEGITDADGYQLQANRGDNWVTVKADEDQLVLLQPSHVDSVIGYEATVDYRVRALLSDGSEVTPWSAVRSVITDPGNVLYEVEGTAWSASVTMRTNSGSEQANIDVPLESRSGTTGLWLQATNMTPYLSAQATSSGSITCRITVKGTVVSENTSSGRGSIATCSP